MAPPDLSLSETLPELRRQGLSVSYWRLWAACAEGRVPAHRQGREWRIRRSDLSRVAEAFRLAARSRAA